ncbi:MAG TPA: ATP-binding cassette domain-containing protein [Mycobacterium sp.]|nr:ATP-binding cassette domain-containing protein [Mycobacterium sp.]
MGLRARGKIDVEETLPQLAGTAANATGESPVCAELLRVSKAFGPTQALSDVSFVLRAGEVLALVGENGAGKSTCVKILGGVYQPDSGQIRVAGQDVTMHSALDAQRLGIAVVNQHPGLFGDLSIAENIFAGKPLRGPTGLLDHGRMRREATTYLDRVGLRRDPSTLANALRTSEQQMVEIARALAAEAAVLILDEPTAALSTREVDTLFGVIDQLRNAGVAMMFVGHRLEEIFRIADRVAILRDGQLVDTRHTDQITEGDAVRLMVGRALTNLYPDRRAEVGDVVLNVSGLAAASGVHDIDLRIRSGEIVGLAGLVGSGRTELARVLFGIDHPSAGTMQLDDRNVTLRSPADALARGIAYVSEDRRGQSLVEDFSVLDNATLPVIKKATRFGLVFKRVEMALVSSSLQQMSLRFHSYDQPVGTLSGGNQQKVVLAKWLATNPRLLILDEPTQGIDVAAKAEVHRIVSALAEQGLAILLISSDMPEVLGMSDRVLVMRRGRLVAEFAGAEATQEAIASAATGVSIERPEPDVADMAFLPRVAVGKGDVASGIDARAATAANPTRPFVGWLRVLAARREVGLLGALLAMIIPISIVNSRFLSSTNLASVSAEASLVGLVAAGQLLVVLTRNIDVSVGSVIGLSAYLFGSFVKDHPGTPIIVAFLIAAGVGLGCGLVNGLVVGYGKVPSIVVTLGTLYVYRGIDSILSNGKEIAPGDIPQSVQDFLSHQVLGVSTLVWLGIAVFAIVGAALRWTLRGREMYQVGSNPEGARLIGVPINRRVLAAFAVSGLLAGVDGALWASHYGIVDGQSAYGLELTVVAAVVVGGVALRGGYGSALGVALGTVALFTIQNVLELAKVNSDDLQAFYGAAIITAVTLDMLIARRSRRVKAVL